jgi:hypothetical protein
VLELLKTTGKIILEIRFNKGRDPRCLGTDAPVKECMQSYFEDIAYQDWTGDIAAYQDYGTLPLTIT